MKDKKFFLNEHGEPAISLCQYDKERCCSCMTKSILSEDGTHHNCEKCGAVK